MANYQPGPGPGPAPQADFPGKTLGLVGMILAIIPCTYFVGLILSIIAFIQSRNVGVRNQKAFIGIVVGCVWLALSIIGNITGTFTSMMNQYR